MAKVSKRYQEAAKLVDRTRLYTIEEAVKLLKEMPHTKFDETVELAMKLGVDPRHADQMVRGTVRLPHGTGKQVRVLVFAKGEHAKIAEEAGADFVGADELIKKIQDGWLEFDVAVATPDMMREVGKLGKILGPRGLMPSPKTGTVTFDLEQVIKEIKAGRVDFRVDREGNIHMGVGKVSFPEEHLIDNILAAFDAVLRAKPPGAKGQYIKRATLSSTMSPGIRLDVNSMMAMVR